MEKSSERLEKFTDVNLIIIKNFFSKRPIIQLFSS